MLSRDEKTPYVTNDAVIVAFDVQPDGTVTNQRDFARLEAISAAFSGPRKQTLYIVGSGALGPDGQEIRTPDGIRNNAKSIYKLPMLAQGFTGRAK
jgi:gluconolactonase